MATTTPDKPLLPAELRGELTPGQYNLEQMYRFAQICQQSGLFEDVTDAAQAFVKIAKGQELGLPPMIAMTAFDIIRKRLFIKPSTIAAKINSCGYGRYKVLEQSPQCCRIRFARKVQGVGWDDCPEVSYTFAEAQSHGLVERSPHWKASPAHMLYQRCMGRGGAMYFPELLAGLEPPPDETPVTEAQRVQNVVELFGEGSDPTAYTILHPPVEIHPDTALVPSTAQHGPEATVTGEVVTPPARTTAARGAFRRDRRETTTETPEGSDTAPQPPQGESSPLSQTGTENLFKLEEEQAREAEKQGK
jgi:hypothetical protein